MARVDSESRICFALEWYDSEQEADERGERVRQSGQTINGGWNHGSPCGRAAGFDREVDGVKWYAVTTA